MWPPPWLGRPTGSRVTRDNPVAAPWGRQGSVDPNRIEHMFECEGDTLTVGAGMPVAAVVSDGLDAEALLDGVAAFDRVIAFAHAAQARLLAKFAALRPAEFAADEVAPALRVSRMEATRRLGLAVDLK